MKSYKSLDIAIKINPTVNAPGETNQLILLHNGTLTNSITVNSPNLDGRLGLCCYWSLIIGFSGLIIGPTIWCLIHYYA